MERGSVRQMALCGVANEADGSTLTDGSTQIKARAAGWPVHLRSKRKEPSKEENRVEMDSRSGHQGPERGIASSSVPGSTVGPISHQIPVA